MYMNGRDNTSRTAMKMSMSRQDGTKFIRGKKTGAPAQAIMRIFNEKQLASYHPTVPEISLI